MTRLLWLSFIAPDHGKGVCLIELDDEEIEDAKEALPQHYVGVDMQKDVAAAALRKAHDMECNPGGDVLVFDLTKHVRHYDNYPRYRVLSVWELNQLAEQG